MADTPPAPRFPVLRQYALAALAAAVSALAARYLPEPRTVEKTVEVPAPAPLIDATPIDYEGHRFDGGHDHDHRALPLVGGKAEAAKWPTDRITYGIDYASARGLNPPLSEDAIRSMFRQGMSGWADQLQIDLVEVAYTGGPMIPCSFEYIDGPGGILAQAFLADNTLRPKPLVLDSSERWTAGAPASNLVSGPAVIGHEGGHSLGLGHDSPNAQALMRPTYSSTITRPQARDIERAVQLGYKRRVSAPPGPVDTLSIPATIRVQDVKDAFERAGYKVTPP